MSEQYLFWDYTDTPGKCIFVIWKHFWYKYSADGELLYCATKTLQQLWDEEA